MTFLQSYSSIFWHSLAARLNKWFTSCSWVSESLSHINRHILLGWYTLRGDHIRVRFKDTKHCTLRELVWLVKEGHPYHTLSLLLKTLILLRCVMARSTAYSSPISTRAVPGTLFMNFTCKRTWTTFSATHRAAAFHSLLLIGTRA